MSAERQRICAALDELAGSVSSDDFTAAKLNDLRSEWDRPSAALFGQYVATSADGAIVGFDLSEALLP